MVLQYLPRWFLLKIAPTLVFASLLFPISLKASPTGNPANPVLLDYSTWGVCIGPVYDTLVCPKDYSQYKSPFSMGLKAGFYGDFVFNQHMQVEDVPMYIGDKIGLTIPLRKMSFNQSGLSMTFNFQGNDPDEFVALWDWEVFGVVGGTTMHLSIPMLAFREPTQTDEPMTSVGILDVNTDWGLSYNVGARKILFRYDDLIIGASVEHKMAFPIANEILVFQVDSPEVYFEESKHTLAYKEWTGSIGMCTRINNYCFPYINFSGGYSRIRPSNPNDIFSALSSAFLDWSFVMRDMVARHYFSGAFGMSYLCGNNASVTVEGRWGQQNAISVDMHILF